MTSFEKVVDLGISEGKRAFIWVWTVNNYSDDHLKMLRGLHDAGTVKWVAWAKEVGASGTPHLQGIFSLTTATRWNTLKARFPGFWLSACKRVANYLQYIRPISRGGRSGIYTDKDGLHHHKDANPDDAYEEYGVVDIDGAIAGRTKGGRSERLDEWHELIHRPDVTEDEIEAHPMASLPGYMRVARDLLAKREAKEDLKYAFSKATRFEDLPNWARRAVDFIRGIPPDRRRIIWIWSAEGRLGKTQLLFHLEAFEGFQYHVIQKSADIARQIDKRSANFAFDLSRDFKADATDFSPYTLMENIKNCFVPNPKYDGKNIRLRENRLVVASNQPPDFNRISRDRFYILHIVSADCLRIIDEESGTADLFTAEI